MKIPPSERFIWKSIIRLVCSVLILISGINIAIGVFNTSAAFMPMLAVLVMLLSWVPLVYTIVYIVRHVYYGLNDMND